VRSLDNRSELGNRQRNQNSHHGDLLRTVRFVCVICNHHLESALRGAKNCQLLAAES
jgi:hypothetical protein